MEIATTGRADCESRVRDVIAVANHVVLLRLLRCAGGRHAVGATSPVLCPIHSGRVAVLLATTDPCRHLARHQTSSISCILHGHRCIEDLGGAVHLWLPEGHLHQRLVPIARHTESRCLRGSGHYPGLAGGHSDVAGALRASMVCAVALHAFRSQLQAPHGLGSRSRVRNMHVGDRRRGRPLRQHTLQSQVPLRVSPAVVGCEDGVPNMSRYLATDTVNNCGTLDNII
mmetsp:Transcript_30041/g.70004  ORF Transcript_30041/g.70004 Transcript_30041/m.70004 type:complete len:228 (-) Transcript_30041:86-769(-)